MKKSLLLILAASLGLAACNNFENAGAGTVYKIHKSGDAKTKIAEGDFVKFQLIQTMDEDSLMYSSYDAEQPVVFQLPKKMYSGDMYDVLTHFGEGDSATFKLNIDSMAKYSKQPRPAEMKGTNIVFKVKIEKVFHKNAGEPDSLFNQRASEFFKKDYDELLARLKNGEDAKIKAYEAENNLKTQVTASGLHYFIEKEGTGAKPVVGDTVKANYTGKFTKKKSDGKDNVFDTSDINVAKASGKYQPMAPYGPRDLVIGGIVQGMQEALMMLGAGGKGTFIIPSRLAYGEAGSRPVIGPYQPLVFTVEVSKINKGNGAMPPPPPVMNPAN